MTASDAPLLEARGVGRRASGNGPWLLRHVDLALGSGERVAVVGPSGAGKSLLLRALALLDAIEEGEILWRGAPVADDDVPAYRSGAVYLHQRPALFEGTVESNLRRPLGLAAASGRAWDRERILGWLEPLGRGDDFLALRSDDLSGGEAQIAAFLRAVQLDPDVLLLDEPTSALDPAASRAVESLVERWFDARPDDRSLVWVGHDAAQASRVTDRALRLDGGRVA